MYFIVLYFVHFPNQEDIIVARPFLPTSYVKASLSPVRQQTRPDFYKVTEKIWAKATTFIANPTIKIYNRFVIIQYDII